jgi:hypothetical protein
LSTACVPFGRITKDIVLPRVKVSVTIEYDRHRRVAGEHGHLFGMSAFGAPQRDGGVPKIVDARGVSLRLDGRSPRSAPEEARTNGMTLR